MTTKLSDLLHGVGIVSAVAQQQFLQKSNLLNLARNKDLMHAGKANDREYLLVDGILHRYNVTEEGQVVTTGFYMPGSVVTPHFARTKNGKSIFCLQTLTEAVVLEIDVKDLDMLRHNNPEIREFGQRVVEKELFQTFQNEVLYRSCIARERLLAMREQFPNLENLVPHQFIAAYLGITAVSLSRLRNELSRLG